MMATATKMVTAVFRSQSNSEKAFEALRELGYPETEIDVLMSEGTRKDWYSKEEGGNMHKAGSMAVEGVGVGGTLGTAIGATLGAVVAIGTSIALPGLGLIVAGPIVAALAGGGAGAVTGGLVGGLVGLGISEENAQAYQEVLRQGGVAIGVAPHANEDIRKIKKVFEDNAGDNIIYS
jgi:hypothetical protein